MKSLLLLAVATLSAPLLAQQVQLGSGSVVQTVTTLRAGQFVWAPQVAPEGPMLLIVNLATQRALLFRNGVPIGASTVSTGKKGRETPTGVFTILQKQVEHYSSKYDNAPMPFMQRLTVARRGAPCRAAPWLCRLARLYPIAERVRAIALWSQQRRDDGGDHRSRCDASGRSGARDAGRCPSGGRRRGDSRMES